MTKSTMTVDEYGNKHWKNEIGALHRLDGPAVEYVDSEKHWCQNGRLHREDGPAVELQDGSVDWYFKDECLGKNIDGFWRFWERLDEDQRQNVNLHMWLKKLTNS